MNYKIGQTVHHKRGWIGHYEGQIVGRNAHAVSRIVGHDVDGDPIYGDVEMWPDAMIGTRAFPTTEAPGEREAVERIAKLRQDAAEEQVRLDALRAERVQIEHAAKQHEPIRMMLRWLEADDLWIVSSSPYQGIIRASEMVEGAALRAVLLRLEKGRRVTARACRYEDGSDSSAQACTIHTSEADARAEVARLAAHEARCGRAHNADLWATKYPDCPYDPETMAAIHASRRAAAERTLAAATKDAEAAKERADKARAVLVMVAEHTT
jgi:hypothetical protein